jgi:hypothetical protein
VTKDATKFGTIFAYAHLLPTYNYFAAHLQPLLIIELCIMNYHTKHHTNYNNINNININNNITESCTKFRKTITKKKKKAKKCSEHYKILQHQHLVNNKIDQLIILQLINCFTATSFLMEETLSYTNDIPATTSTSPMNRPLQFGTSSLLTETYPSVYIV